MPQLDESVFDMMLARALYLRNELPARGSLVAVDVTGTGVVQAGSTIGQRRIGVAGRRWCAYGSVWECQRSIGRTVVSIRCAPSLG